MRGVRGSEGVRGWGVGGGELLISLVGRRKYSTITYHSFGYM